MIERRTPLKRGAPPKRAKPPAKQGRKAEREKPALDLFRDALEARSGGRCEAATLVDLTGQRVCGRIGPHAGTDPHHVWPDDRDRGMHVPSRGLWLCRSAHDWAHHVAPPAEAAALGLLRPCQSVITIGIGGHVPTDEQAVAAAALLYEDDPATRSVVIEYPLGRLVVPPPGIAVEWRT